MTNAPMPPALLLVGGLGTRLRNVVSDRPKPMADINGRPFLEWLVRYLKAQGVTQVIFASGYMAESIEEHFGDGSAFGIQISYSVEDKPLGTGGAIRHAAPQIQGERFFMINGDTLYAVPLQELIEAADSKNAHLCLSLHHVENNSRYGQVALAGDRIRGFSEKPAESTPSWINGGTFLMDYKLLERFPYKRKFSFEEDVLPNLIREKVCIGVQQHAYFVDIGLPETYEAFQKDLPELIEAGIFDMS